MAGTDLDAGARGVARRDGQDPLRTSGAEAGRHFGDAAAGLAAARYVS
ncbi:hypothetical protein [Streptomyces canus]|nr:hypothetical protein [Streptomyces canus]